MTQPLLDTHVHFWDPAQLSYPWLAEIPQLNAAFLPADLGAATTGLALEKIVFVEADVSHAQQLAEVAWVTALAASEPRLAGIVAAAPLEQGEAVRGHLQDLAAYPLVKGVRRLLQAEPPGFATQPNFIRGVQLLREFDFSFDICIKHHHLGEVIQLVAQCPDIAFVLDHIGKPDIKAQRFDPWRAEIKKLASFPNVVCKISGLVTEADLKQWTLPDLRPYLDHVLEVFGPERVMYGGDWPLSTLAATYQAWLETLQEATTALSAAERQRLFYENGQLYYRLGG
jgi:L-fuconolactonase